MKWNLSSYLTCICLLQWLARVWLNDLPTCHVCLFVCPRLSVNRLTIIDSCVLAHSTLFIEWSPVQSINQPCSPFFPVQTLFFPSFCLSVCVSVCKTHRSPRCSTRSNPLVANSTTANSPASWSADPTSRFSLRRLATTKQPETKTQTFHQRSHIVLSFALLSHDDLNQSDIRHIL